MLKLSRLFILRTVPVALLWVMVVLSGCLSTAAGEVRWGYVCTDGYEFTATFARNDKSVVVTDADQELSLKNLRVASGARYSDGSMDLWTKGAHAFIHIDGKMAHSDCTGSQF